MQTSSWKLTNCVMALVWPVLGAAQEHNPVAREPAAAGVSVAASANVIVKLRTRCSGGTARQAIAPTDERRDRESYRSQAHVAA